MPLKLNNMHPNYLILLALFLFIANANAEDNQFGQGIMAISKNAGACGILGSMINFQKTTKMQGGDEFVNRFWVTEAARLGISMDEYVDRCNRSIEVYDKFWEAMEPTQ